MTRRADPLSEDERHALETGLHADPFALLGPRDGWLRVLAPGARGVVVRCPDGRRLPLGPCGPEAAHSGLFSAWAPALQGCRPGAYRLLIDWADAVQDTIDPYAFGPIVDSHALQQFSSGDWRAIAALRPDWTTLDGVQGLRCAVWAPNARRVALVGDFNAWDSRRHPMRLRHPAGVWEFFLPDAQPGDAYKFAILDAAGFLHWKADPLARQAECPPGTASLVPDPVAHEWTDAPWIASRPARHDAAQPISIYEVHAGSWTKAWGSAPLWEQLAEQLPVYAKRLGFTHIELMPIMEHPFGGSWGYQPLGLFAPTARYGRPIEFARFVDACHAHELGVILDWVPSHFPADAHGLDHFDGTALYEHADPREGFHPDWHSSLYNLGRNEVRAFLLASAHEWLERYHIDGLRVDAVASMLYRDYSRAPGQWIPNQYGGRENLESIAFLRELTDSIRHRSDGTLTIAEESTAWPGVTAPVQDGGLGFDYKWNMGWMHDTLRYLQRDPIHRRHHHGDLTFGLSYVYSEQFILALSHDEVVHGKGALASKMGGPPALKLQSLRAYLAFMWAHPGKKLLFMGGEIGQWREWSHERSVDWHLLDQPAHAAVQAMVHALNALYGQRPALHAGDADPTGFLWTIADDVENSVLAFERRARNAAPILVLCNFTPVQREGYRVGVSVAGHWQVLFDSRPDIPSGSSIPATRTSSDQPDHGYPQSLTLDLPGLTTLMLSPTDG